MASCRLREAMPVAAVNFDEQRRQTWAYLVIAQDEPSRLVLSRSGCGHGQGKEKGGEEVRSKAGDLKLTCSGSDPSTL